LKTGTQRLRKIDPHQQPSAEINFSGK
jgi:hypothetical protein